MGVQSDLYQSITDRIIAALETGTAPWVKPWKDGRQGGALPHNAITGRPYHGINTILLWGASALYGSQSWLTFKQAEERGGHVKRGEVYAPNEDRDEEDEDAEEMEWRDGTEDELMTADAYVSAALSAWR